MKVTLGNAMLYNEIKNIARELRQKMTPEEKLIWGILRNRRMNGKKFLRQHPIIYGRIDKDCKFFIADFYCDEYKLVLEIDGKIHDFQKDYDQNRDNIMKEMGMKIVRIKNEEVKDINKVSNIIKMALT